MHAFVKKDQLLQLTPAYILVSRRRRVKYQSALEALVDATPRWPRVQVVVTNFELAVWTAVRHMLPGVVMQGCNFHFAQYLK